MSAPSRRPSSPPQTRWVCPTCQASGWWTPSTHAGRRPLLDHDRPAGGRCNVESAAARALARASRAVLAVTP